MSNFTYSKYEEIINKTELQLQKLKQVQKSDYNSYEVEDIARKLISIGNSLLMYIKHSEKI